MAGSTTAKVAKGKPVQTEEIQGFVDAVSPVELRGWALYRNQPDKRVVLDILLDDTIIDTATCDRFRPDLKKREIGDGFAGFRFLFREDLSPTDLSRIVARVSGSDVVLKWSGRARDYVRAIEEPGEEQAAIVVEDAAALDSGYVRMVGDLVLGIVPLAGATDGVPRLAVAIDDKPVAEVPADQPAITPDGRDAGTGYASFTYRIPEQYWDLERHRLRISGSGDALIKQQELPFRIASRAHEAQAIDNDDESLLEPNFGIEKFGRTLAAESRDTIIGRGWTLRRSGKETAPTTIQGVLVKAAKRAAKARLHLSCGQIEHYIRLLASISLDRLVFGEHVLRLTLHNQLKTVTQIRHVRILVKERRAYRDAALLRSNITALPGRSEILMPVTRDHLRAALRHAVENDTLSICIEFAQPVDLLLEDVSLVLGKDPSASERFVRSGPEDLSVKHQFEASPLREFLRAYRPSYGRPVSAFAAAQPQEHLGDWPPVTIVVCVHNGLDYVRRCLRSLVEKTPHPYEIVVVDDASDEDTAAFLTAFAAKWPCVRVMTAAVNQGYTKSANRGMQAATTPFVVLLNSDTEVTPGWLHALLRPALRDQSVAMVGPLSNAASWQSVPERFDTGGKWAVNQLPPDTTVDEYAAQIAMLSRRDYPEVPLLNGFCTLIRKEALERLGFLDEKAFPWGYGEENDLCIRAVQSGFKLVIADDAYVYHHKSQSFGDARRTELSKQGNAVLASKHPKVDIKLLTNVLRENETLASIRAQLTAQLGSSPVASAAPPAATPPRPKSAARRGRA